MSTVDEVREVILNFIQAVIALDVSKVRLLLPNSDPKARHSEALVLATQAQNL